MRLISLAVLGSLFLVNATATVLAFPARSADAQERGRSAESTRRPNIVLILVDDLGWADLACYGSDLHQTPNVDALANRGMRFTDAYASAPVCSPTRAALLSGKHPARMHMTIWREAAKTPPLKRKVIPPITVADLPLSIVTIAERLKDAGYLTAHIGKWHLGDAAHYPETQGFDFEVGGTHWGCPSTFFHPYRGMSHGELRYVPGLGLGKQDDYLTDRLTDQALGFIDAAKDRPFFLYMAYYTVHTPIEGKPNLVKRFQKKLRPAMRHANPAYAAMVYSMDENVGRILDHIKKSHLDDRTLVILTSDNGGFINRWGPFPAVTNNAPLRSGKGSLYEGGIRVPLIVRWPGVTRAAATCSEPVVLTDVYPTILEAVDLKKDTSESFDGFSWVPLLRDAASELPRNSLFWHYPHYYPTTTPVSAMRSGNWKLLEYLEDYRLELYDLSVDPGERKNLATTNRAKADQMRDRLHAWRKEVGAQMPTTCHAKGAPKANSD